MSQATMAMVREQQSSCHLRHATSICQPADGSYIRAFKSEPQAHHSHSAALQVLGMADGQPKLNTTAALKANLPDLVGIALAHSHTAARRESAWKHLSFSDADKVLEILAEARVLHDERILFGHQQTDDEAPEVEELLELEEEETPWSDGEENEQVLLQQEEQTIAASDVVSASSSKMARLLALRIVYGSPNTRALGAPCMNVAA
eukprot:3440477-Amphidinium_carterae.1